METSRNNINFNNIPSALKNIDNFLIWKEEQRGDNEKPTKVPYSFSNIPINVKEQSNLNSFQSTVDYYKDNKDVAGIGFSIVDGGITNDKGERLTFFDIDNTLDDPLIELLKNKTYIEVSPSGNGLHAYFFVDYHERIHENPKNLKYELYNCSRYFTLTGDKHKYSTDDIESIDIDTFNEILKPFKEYKNNTLNEIPVDTKKLHENNGTCKLDDREITSLLLSNEKRKEDYASALLGNFENYKDRDGNTPLKANGTPDISAIDQSLMNELAFITKGDYQRMREYYRACEHWYRPHKDKDNGGISSTINKAISYYHSQNLITVKDDKNEFSDIPKPYIVENTELKKEVQKGSKKDPYTVLVRVSRDIPRIKRILQDVETNHEYYEVEFLNIKRNRTITIEKLGSVFQDSRKIKELADYGVSVAVSTELINYFENYMSYNVPPTVKAVKRLGHIKNNFIYPSTEYKNKYKIITDDEGYKDILEAFKVKGTLEEYKDNVFSLLQGNTVATFYFYSALASMLASPFNAEPFIVDINDRTSTGKTALLRLVSSIYGHYKNMVISWDTTLVNIERRSAFLNSFPLFVDDTQKFNGDKKDLSSFIYNYSNGQSRGRGNVHSIERMRTWNNILLSTGEDSMDEFTDNKGGAGARAITIKEKPFTSVDFDTLYKNINNYHGTLGLEFYKQFESNKKKYYSAFEEFNKKYRSLANGSEVLERIGRATALIELAGYILNDIQGFETDYKEVCEYVFNNMVENNKSVDTFKEALVEILEELDVSHIMKNAGTELILDKGQIVIGANRKDFLVITPYFLKQRLGVSYNSTIKEWHRKGYLVHDNDRLQKSIRLDGRFSRVIAIKKEIVEELGFDFTPKKQDHSQFRVIETRNK